MIIIKHNTIMIFKKGVEFLDLISDADRKC